MVTIDTRTVPIPPELEAEFWSLLRAVMKEVLHVSDNLAEHYREQLREASLSERWLALHDDPMNVAAELSGVAVTAEQLAQYDGLVQKLYRYQEWISAPEIHRNEAQAFVEPSLPSKTLLPKRITKVCVGESLVGEGAEVAHIDLIMGPRGSSVEAAFCNALTNNKDGFTSLLAVVAPNLPCKPSAILFNKVTIKTAKQAVQMFGPAQHAVAMAVTDCVRDGTIPADEADDIFICVGVFIHWDARDNAKIQQFNYLAVKESIKRAVAGEPRARDVVEKAKVLKHPFAA